MKTLRVSVGDAQFRADDQVSGTNTGSHHYLRAPDDGVNWRVRGTVVHYELAGRRPVKDCERVCRCRACKQLKPRKGGRNVNYVFVCADCTRSAQ